VFVSFELTIILFFIFMCVHGEYVMLPEVFSTFLMNSLTI
jgi:hypothetical protein